MLHALVLVVAILLVGPEKPVDDSRLQFSSNGSQIQVAAEGFLATADKAVYDTRSGALILEGGEDGKAFLRVFRSHEPGERISGRKIYFYLKTGKWRVIGGR